MDSVEVVHVRDYGTKNKRVSSDTLYVYCGRPSRLKNPYPMKKESDRTMVIEKYAADQFCLEECEAFKVWVSKKPWIRHLKLGCFCAPKACHCDVIRQRILDERM